MDTLLHILLGLVLMFAFHAAVLLLGPMLAAGLAGAFSLYFREVTQDQALHYHCDFRSGWNPAKWSAAKNLETWIPVCVVFGVAMAIEFGVL